MMTYRQERSSRCDIFADDQRIFRTRDRRSLLISFAKRVANGMAFLESKKVSDHRCSNLYYQL